MPLVVEQINDHSELEKCNESEYLSGMSEIAQRGAGLEKIKKLICVSVRFHSSFSSVEGRSPLADVFLNLFFFSFYLYWFACLVIG